MTTPDTPEPPTMHLHVEFKLSLTHAAGQVDDHGWVQEFKMKGWWNPEGISNAISEEWRRVRTYKMEMFEGDLGPPTRHEQAWKDIAQLAERLASSIERAPE